MYYQKLNLKNNEYTLKYLWIDVIIKEENQFYNFSIDSSEKFSVEEES